MHGWDRWEWALAGLIGIGLALIGVCIYFAAGDGCPNGTTPQIVGYYPITAGVTTTIQPIFDCESER